MNGRKATSKAKAIYKVIKVIRLDTKPFYLSAEDIQWVEYTLTSLTVEEKVGQLFVVVDLPFGQKEKPDLLKIKPGGVHVFAFGPNAKKEHQQSLIRDLQKRSALPLLISGDLENGGQGGAADGTNFATNMQLAAVNDLDLSAAFGEGIEAEGTALGFNWVFGPVADINVNFQNPIVNIRAFGDTPEIVAKNATAVIQGIQKNGRMAACAKHWPGGSTAVILKECLLRKALK
jgi:beta-N-acetylhexosaminidase